ncbi:MAG TPA: hypothetical protein VGL38_09495 [bacterium]
MKKILAGIQSFIGYLRERILELPALWAALRAYLHGLIAVLRLISMMLARTPAIVG